MTEGFFFLLKLEPFSAVQEIYPLITGAGLGSLFAINLIAIQAAMSVKDMATTTGTMGLMR
jgi:hypothetical protein